MAHHKRRRPKNRRAGCLLCKPWKANGMKRSRKQLGWGNNNKMILVERELDKEMKKEG